MKHPNNFQVLIALDQLANTFCGGMADETLSSRAHRRRIRGKPFLAAFIDGLFFWQKDHCRRSYESELKRSHLPETMREDEDA